MATVQSLTFSPTSITGCSLWLDANDRNSLILSGSSVLQWNDKSGNGFALTSPTSGQRPNISSSPFSRCVNFTTSQYINTTTSLTLAPTQSFFVVFSGQSNAFVGLEHSADTNVNDGMYFFGGNGALYQIKRGASANSVYDTTSGAQIFTTNANYLVSLVNSNTGSYIWNINGTTRTLTPYSAFTSLSGNATASFYINNRVAANVSHAELLVYNRALTLTEVTQIEGYLAWKWGLQGSLPTTHPYYYIAPNSQNLGYPTVLRMPVPVQSFVQSSTPFSFGFSPKTVSGIQQWLDGSDPNGTGILPSSGTAITTWVDKSGVGNSATSVGTAAYTNGAINGIPALRFNGSTSSYNTVDLYSNRSFTLFVLLRRQGTPADMGFMGGSGTTLNSNLVLIFINSGNGLRYAFYSNDLDYNSFPAQSQNSSTEPTYLLVFTYTPGTRVIWLNGTNVAQDANSTNLASNLNPRIGSFSTVSYFNGFIGETITLNGTPSTTSRQQIEGYLAWKWGIAASLPSNHPFKNGPPGLSLPAPIIPTRSFQQSQFSPRNISGIQVWLDGQDPLSTGIVPANGSTLSSWFDKSGNGRHATGGVSPTYTVSQGVTFNGSTQYLTLPSAAIPSGNSASSYFVVVYPTSVSSTAPKVYLTAASDTNVLNSYVQFIENSSVNLYWTLYNPSLGGINLGTNAIINQFALVEYVYTQGLQITGYLNGAQLLASPTSSLNIGNTYVYIGGNPAQTWWYTGSVCEILVYNQTLSKNQRQSVEGYLAWKWGLVGNLPATHPFKKFPPPPN